MMVIPGSVQILFLA